MFSLVFPDALWLYAGGGEGSVCRYFQSSSLTKFHYNQRAGPEPGLRMIGPVFFEPSCEKSGLAPAGGVGSAL